MTEAFRPGPAKHLTATGPFKGAPGFYGPSGPGDTSSCPDCGRPADADFRDHAGTCVDFQPAVSPASALGHLRRFALAHEQITRGALDTEFARRRVSDARRDAAIASAERRGWLHRVDVGGWRSTLHRSPRSS